MQAESGMAPPYAMRFGVLLLLVFQVSSSVFGFMDLNKQCGSEDEYKECQFKVGHPDCRPRDGHKPTHRQRLFVPNSILNPPLSLTQSLTP